MRIIMKLIFYLSKKKTNKKGLAPIYARITVTGERSEFSTGYFVDPNEWKDERVKETSDNNVLINANLAKIRHDISQMYYYHTLKLKGGKMTAESLKNCYTKGALISMTLLQLLSEFVDHKMKQITKYGSYISYKLRYNILVEYFNNHNMNNITPAEFNEQRALHLKDWLKHEKKYTNNYSVKVIMFLKGALIYGCRIGQIDKSPLQYFYLKNDKPKPIVALEKCELQKLMKHKFASTRLQHVADLYVFQSLTGFAYVDLYDFDYEKHVRVVDGREFIFKKRIKVDSEAIIPMFKDAKAILKKYDYKLPEITNQRYNAYLKEVAEILGIKKLLTTHTARKTFAMIKLNDGFSIETVSKMLGHTNTKMTLSTYASVSTKRISSELVKLKIA